jgi:hypothetical protein
LLGRVLLFVGFVWAIWLDPWSLSETDPAALLGSPSMAARHAQAVVVGMAVLQLIIAAALGAGGERRKARCAVALLSGLGASVYSAGYALAPFAPPAVWLIPAGALLNLAACALLFTVVGRGPGTGVWRVILPVICLGMVLDAAMGLFAAEPAWFLPSYLGPPDGVRMRMLRLARAAAIALPAVTLLFEGLAARAASGRPLARQGRALLWTGVATMSTILAVAAFTSLLAKFLLAVPALTTFAGTCVAVALAHRHARPLEVWGWVLVASSMGGGLLMGLYAFAGPFPDPVFLGAYNDFPRRLVRLGHAYCIVLGLVAIFLARELDSARPISWSRRAGVPLLLAGTTITLIVISLVAFAELPPSWLAVGPALVAPALVLCLQPLLASR